MSESITGPANRKAGSAEPLIRELLRGEYLDKRENVLLVGNPGTGKTHLVCAPAFSACAQGRNVRFYTATDLVTQLVECREERRLQRKHKQLQRLHLLVIDELGYAPFSKAGAESITNAYATFLGFFN